MRNFSFSIKSNTILTSSNFLIRWLFWKSWPIKLIPLADNEKLKMVLSSVLVYLLCHKHCETKDEDKDGRDKKMFSPFYKNISMICWELYSFIGMLKFEWKVKFFPNFFNQRGRNYFPAMFGAIV